MNETRTLSVKTLVMASLSALPPSRRRSRRRKAVVNDLLSAERVLDWVERKGGVDTHLNITGKAFVVQWREGA